MRESDESLIRGFPIFRGVSNVALSQLAAVSSLADFEPGHVLLREGERPSHLFVLLNGVVETFSEPAGKKTTLSFIRPPSAFIVAAVWLDQVQLTSARVLLHLPDPRPFARQQFAQRSAKTIHSP